jgi:PII-like signaling protein
LISTLPVRIEFVEAQTKVEALLLELFELITDGMIEAQGATSSKWRAAQFPNAGGGG